ncbi:MAG TPA: DegT/DnrJ/EryC1/StrS family aminotransferase [Myxococcaceae bacterium]|nr:DegT/DnrJ/EryC1/StrS family aminotransferase [Myxococcaceae bacterium]
MQRLAIHGGTPAVPAGTHVRWPVLGEDERRAVLGVLDRGVLSGQLAPEVRGLEREFAAFVGSRYCLATNSGTSALHLALLGAGVRPGDEVVVPAFTFVATAMAVLHQGAVPVFVDVEPQTLGMDPARAEAAITPRTRAIVPVHLHGIPCELQPIADIAARRGLLLIEDSAQAIGARYRGRMAGTLGLAGCYSLQSSKSMACGEGGLLVTDDEALYRRAHAARMFGEDSRPEDEASYDLAHALDGNRAYDSAAVGWNYRTSELPAAVARVQLRRLEHWNASALANAQLLTRRLGELPGVTPPEVPADRAPAFHKYRVQLDASRLGVDAEPVVVRDSVLRALRAEGCEVVLWQTLPVPGQTLFRRTATPADDLAQYPVTRAILDRSLCLFSQTYPIAPQPRALVEAYAEAFARVWMRLPEVLSRARAG